MVLVAQFLHLLGRRLLEGLASLENLQEEVVVRYVVRLLGVQAVLLELGSAEGAREGKRARLVMGMDQLG